MINIHPANKGHEGFQSLAPRPDNTSNNEDPENHKFARLIWLRDVQANVSANDAQLAKLWECRNEAEARPRWIRMTFPPRWHSSCSYRYAPPGTGPGSLLSIGQEYWCVNLFTPDLLHEGVWEDTEQQREWYDRGLIFLTKQKAIDAAHAVYTYIKGRPK